MPWRGWRALGTAGTAALLLLAACAGPRAALQPQAVAVGYEETGDASWYGHPYHGRRTASGEVYDMYQLTGAHRTLPFGTWTVVESLDSGRTVTVRINDRGPFTAGRILDLSYAAARVLGAVGPGVIPVRLRVTDVPDTRRGAGRGSFSIQVGAFAEVERADALKLDLERTWSDAAVQPAEVRGQTLYRVRIGGFATRVEAERAAERLAGAGHAVIVVEE